MKIEVNDLVRYYGDFCAVNKANFSFESGKITALVGRNGSGKTTTIRTMLGLIKKDSGSIIVDGKESAINVKNLGYLAEERGLFQKQVVKDQLMFFSNLKGSKKKDALCMIDKWLDRLEISQYKNSKLENLSKGNQQKVQMVASLITNPDIIIFDEPFSGLDPVNMNMVLNLLKELRDEGKCILVSSHQLSLIENICEDVCIIDKSIMRYTGSLQNLKYQYGENYVQFSLNKKVEVPLFLNSVEFAPLNYKIEINEKLGLNFNKILKKLADCDLPINSVERTQKSLQDIFVELVGEEKLLKV